MLIPTIAALAHGFACVLAAQEYQLGQLQSADQVDLSSGGEIPYVANEAIPRAPEVELNAGGIRKRQLVTALLVAVLTLAVTGYLGFAKVSCSRRADINIGQASPKCYILCLNA